MQLTRDTKTLSVDRSLPQTRFENKCIKSTQTSRSKYKQPYSPILFNDKIPPLQEAQLMSRKLSHGNLVTFHCVNLIDLKICHDIHQVSITKRGLTRREHLLR